MRKRSSYLSDDERDDHETLHTEEGYIMRDNRNFFIGTIEPDHTSEGADFEDQNNVLSLPQLVKASANTQQDNNSSHTYSTQEDSELIVKLKKEKLLRYQPTFDMSEEERTHYYSNIAANTANFRAERAIKKCNDTI